MSLVETVPVPSPRPIVVAGGHATNACDAITTPVLTLNPVPMKSDPRFGLEQETGNTDFSTLAVTGPTSGLAADPVYDAAVAAEADRVRWRENGQRQFRSGFRTKTKGRRWFRDEIAPRLDRGAPSAKITFDQILRTVPTPPRRDR